MSVNLRGNDPAVWFLAGKFAAWAIVQGWELFTALRIQERFFRPARTPAGGWGVFCVGDDGGRAWFSVRGRLFHNPPRRAAPYSPAHRISFLKTFAVLHKLIRPLPQLYHESGSFAPI